ncbi:VOC family protein [Streptomyces sp. NPDC001380]|uniref:VOC family protein n=1 Tax=Streptomyces sp. NPDC001380 TaxID=3364566 RepID=UPI00367B7F3C
MHGKLVVDCAGPLAQAAFWAEALGCECEDNSALVERLLASGVVGEEQTVLVDGRRAWRHAAAVRHAEDPVDPAAGTGLGRRLLFQAVPEAREGKRSKNRLHLDLHAGAARRDAEVERLKGLGVAVLRVVDEVSGSHVVLADPEGNEFCVQ